jgi:hypothetical protein
MPYDMIVHIACVGPYALERKRRAMEKGHFSLFVYACLLANSQSRIAHSTANINRLQTRVDVEKVGARPFSVSSSCFKSHLARCY